MPFGGRINVGSDVTWNGVIMVDDVNGSDASGTRNIVSKPFKTIAAAYAVYQEGDLIRVLSGTYTFTSSLSMSVHNEVHFDFIEGSKVTGSFLGQLFVSVTPTLTYFFHGRGEFRNDNVSLNASAGITSGRVWVKGAKKISSASGTLFGTSNGWLNLENIDDMFTEKTGSTFSFTNNANHSDPLYGNVKNCKKIGDPLYPITVALASQIADTSLVVENCGIYGDGTQYTLTSFGDNNVAKFVNCRFIALDYRGFVVRGKNIQFVNCHFQNEDNGLSTVYVEGNDNTVSFIDCTMRNNGLGKALRTLAGVRLEGVNKCYTAGAGALTGQTQSLNKVDGTIYVNAMNSLNPDQIWRFEANTTPPTVGEVYTITAPGGDFIDYTVIALDTRTEVINGLAAAWAVEAAASIDGLFAKFNNLTLTLGAVDWIIQATALDPNDNLDTDNGFVSSTDGADNFDTSFITIADFSWKGNGKLMIDENLEVPNL